MDAPDGKFKDDIVRDPISGSSCKTSALFSISGKFLPVSETQINSSGQCFFMPSMIFW